MTDWAIGDLALCVKTYDAVTGLHSGMTQSGPRVGRVYTVDRTKSFDFGFRIGIGSAPGWMGYMDCEMFIKVTPEEDDEFDREVIELMKGGKVKT